MVSARFKECLLDVYLSVYAAEAVFEVMLVRAQDGEQRYILSTLLQAETEAKVVMRPLLTRLGLPITDSEGTSVGGAAAANQLSSLPWTDRFDALGDMIRATYLPRYLELATLVTPEEDAEAAAIARFMGEHEQAVLQVADNVVQGVPDPAAPLAALLHFPLVRPTLM
ncbi:hypothetical protein [Novosphingobium olei]|uniref:Ferritin-like metal-binding protein YciE n=1 Tax=Novosphingobium olei TaxID=2728851 RepID=A0A7Y0BPJ6_9SPHN|nr:hypothetical protein [Novosphingobium olei]NML94113.1 hypothetical protein [Novosphingobium olei]